MKFTILAALLQGCQALHSTTLQHALGRASPSRRQLHLCSTSRSSCSPRRNFLLVPPRFAASVAAASGVAFLQPRDAWAGDVAAVAEGATASSEEALKEAASLVKYGLVEESKGQWDKAVRYYDKAVSSAPDYALGYVNRANVRVIFGKLDSALSDYDTAIKVSSRKGSYYSELPDRWLFYLNRGTTRLNLPLSSTNAGDKDATVKENAQLCVDDFKQAELLRGPLKPEAIIVENRAQAYERLGNYNLAIADYGSAISLKPNDVAPFWLRYAACLFEAQRDGEAIALARRVKSKFPGEAEVSVVLAGILSQAGIPSSGGAANGSEKQQPVGLTEATNLYRSLPPVQREKYSNPVFLRDTVRWPPRLTAAVIALSKIKVDVDGVLLSVN